ncbi:GntR family transcriptional regulator [Streptomyces fuscigenes]|nr:GntR family transcriptional regulator [Streptomyces fuscigenes]
MADTCRWASPWSCLAAQLRWRVLHARGPTKAKVSYETLREWLASGELAPGGKLPSERTLVRGREHTTGQCARLRPA